MSVCAWVSPYMASGLMSDSFAIKRSKMFFLWISYSLIDGAVHHLSQNPALLFLNTDNASQLVVLDPATHHIYLVAAEMPAPYPATDKGAHLRPKLKPDYLP